MTRPWSFIGKKLVILLMLLGLVGCDNVRPQPSPTPSTTTYTVRVMNAESGEPVKSARVEVSVGSSPLLTQFTDDLGQVVMQIPKSNEPLLAKIKVMRDGFIPYDQTVKIVTDDFPPTIHLKPIDPTPTSLAEATVTTIPRVEAPIAATEIVPTGQTVEANTPTSTVTPTETATPSSTPTVAPTLPQDIVQVKAIIDGGGVYAGPDPEQPRLGIFRFEQIGQAIGKTEHGEWLEIITPQNIQGWVDPQTVEFLTGSVADLPITWDGPVRSPSAQTGSNPTTPSAPQSCVRVSVNSHNPYNKPFDDVTLSWNQAPSGTTRIHLSVYTSISNQKVFLIHPTYSDLNTPYIIESWRYENAGFAVGTQFTYEVRAMDANNGALCLVSGAFVP